MYWSSATHVYSHENDQYISHEKSAMRRRKQIRERNSKVGCWMSDGGEKVSHYDNVAAR